MRQPKMRSPEDPAALRDNGLPGTFPRRRALLSPLSSLLSPLSSLSRWRRASASAARYEPATSAFASGCSST